MSDVAAEKARLSKIIYYYKKLITVGELNPKQQAKYDEAVKRLNELKDAVDENNEQFRNLCLDMRIEFKEQMNKMPDVAQNLKKLEEIPNKLEAVVALITKSQERLASDFLIASQKIINSANKDISQQQSNDTLQVGHDKSAVKFPSSIKWTVIVGMILITIASIGNTAYNIWKGEMAPASVEQTVGVTSDNIETTTHELVADSIYIQNP